MRKLSDPEYRLPKIEALSAFDSFNQGTTVPLGIWGTDIESGKRNHYVVKCKNANRMSLQSSAFELLGAWMAMEIDLPVVEPALVNLSHDFIEIALKGRDGYRAALQSPGINFGSKYESGFSVLPNHKMTLPVDQAEKAKLIYVFDVFIANADRGHQKPNVLSNGKEMLILDHELAFSFVRLLPFLRNPKPWIFNDSDKDVYGKHVFYTLMKETQPDFTKYVNVLKRFDKAFWEKVWTMMPKDWMSDEVKRIEPYLTLIVENHRYFAESLFKSIAL